MVLAGVLIGGDTLVQVGVDDSALTVLKTCPGWPGVPSLKPESVVQTMFGLVGSTAMSVIQRCGTVLKGSMSGHVKPPFVVLWRKPVETPKKEMLPVGSEGANPRAEIPAPALKLFEDQDGLVPEKRLLVRQTLSLAAMARL